MWKIPTLGNLKLILLIYEFELLGVGQLFDKNGRVVFLQGSQVEEPQPFTGRSSTIFLNEDKKNKIWLMLLVALEIETDDIIKIHDGTKKAWNKKFLKFCEKKIQIRFDQKDNA